MNVERWRDQYKLRPFDIVRWWKDGIFEDWGGQLHESEVPGLDGCMVRFSYITDELESDAEREACAELRKWFAEIGAVSVEIERFEVAAGTVPPHDRPEDASRATRRVWEQLLRRGEP